jgi:hypothetical protein
MGVVVLDFCPFCFFIIIKIPERAIVHVPASPPPPPRGTLDYRLQEFDSFGLRTRGFRPPWTKGSQVSESSVGLEDFQNFQGSQKCFWTFRIFSVGLQDFDPLGLWTSGVP